MSKSTWPKTESGTIDWEIVFEGPETGLIHLVSSATTPSILHESTVAIIKMLHSRDDDAQKISKLSVELQMLYKRNIGRENELALLIEGTIAMLRSIKEQRKYMADEHIRLKKAKFAGCRRAKNLKAQKEKDKKSRKQTLIASGIAAVIVIGLVSSILVNKQEKDSTPLKVLINQMEASAKGNPVNTHIFGGNLTVKKIQGRSAVTVFGLPPDACSSTAWYFANRGNVVINGLMPRQIKIQILKELCNQDPAGATLIWIPKKT